MENKLRALLKVGISLIVFAFLFTSCEKENEIVQQEEVFVENEQPKFSVKTIYWKKIHKNHLLTDRLNQLNETLSQKTSSKGERKGTKIKDYDFVIDVRSATYIEEGSYHSFTFPTKQSATEKIKNVFFSLNEDNRYDSYLIEYAFTREEIEVLNAEELSQKTKMSRINIDFGSLAAKFKMSWVCNYEFKKVDNHAGDLDGDNEMVWTVVMDCSTQYGFSIDHDFYEANTSGPPQETNSYSASGGFVSSPTFSVYNVEDLAMYHMLKNELNLSNSEYDFLYHRYDIALDLFNFLSIRVFSKEAETEAKMRIDAERANDNGWDLSNLGTFPNRPSLKYKATYSPNLGETMYLLDNGLGLYQSATKRTINKKIPETIASTEQTTDGYNYIYSYEAKRWYEYRMPPPLPTAKADIDFLLDAFWNGAKIVGRYTTPLEDGIILLDGKDFDGVEQSKAMTAGVMIVGFIPGGKIMKPVAKGTGKVWKFVVKNGDKVFTRTVRELTEETIQHFDNYVDGARDLLQEALRKGDILDDKIIIEIGQEIADLSAKKGRKLTWPEVKALFKRGIDFNRKARNFYEFNEFTLENGKRLDSYVPGQEIISRKATTLADIKLETFNKN